MAQTSGPRTNGTPAQRQFTDTLWGDLFGDGPGIVQDFDGSAYKLTLSSTSDTATVGSDTQDSMSRVGGFNHTIPKGQPETLTISAASGGPQTTILAVKYDPASAGDPCSLVTYPSPGTTDGVPVRGSQPEGVVLLPLYSITRQPAQVLSVATVTDLRQWAGFALYPTTLPSDAPLGAVAFLSGQRTRVRQLVSGAPAWVDPTPIPDRTQSPVLIVGSAQVVGTQGVDFGYGRGTIGTFTATKSGVVTLTFTGQLYSSGANGYAGLIVDGAEPVGARTGSQRTGFSISHVMPIAAGTHTVATRIFDNAGGSSQLTDARVVITFH